MCEPLAAHGTVATFPMKVERKKAREELDVVNVVEWRHPTGKDRWFLLVRRPEGGARRCIRRLALRTDQSTLVEWPNSTGLLAGLHEFPTSDNVASGLSASAMHAIPHELLSTLLAVPPQPYTRPARRRTPGDASSNELGPLIIAEIIPAGDVVHVFSHIKKTYRIQWVLLTGGGPEPPPLAHPLEREAGVGGGTTRTATDADAGRDLKPSRGQRKGAKRQKTGVAGAPLSLEAATWKLLAEVPDAK